MIDQMKLKELLNSPETSTLDFKTKMYDFADDRNQIKTAKFVKDIISFSNTIRSDNSYIIIGVEELSNGTKKFHGLDVILDDAILQDKVKDKVFPRPIFEFYVLELEGKNYGIIEFPIIKHSLPLTTTLKMKGLDVGHVYYRNGTSNTEATGNEIIRISDWLRSLPEIQTDISLTNVIGEQLKKLTTNSAKLSYIVSDLFKISKEYNLLSLQNFCETEIKGLTEDSQKADVEKYKYRIQNVLMTLNEVEVNPYFHTKISASMLRAEMEKNDAFFDFKLLFAYPLSQIEEYVERLQIDTDRYAKFEMSSKQVFPEKKDYPLTVYLFPDTMLNLYRNIKQKAIDILMDF